MKRILFRSRNLLLSPGHIQVHVEVIEGNGPLPILLIMNWTPNSDLKIYLSDGKQNTILKLNFSFI